MKLYTRIGDDGTTRLYGNQQVRKDDPRVQAYGSVDETNCAIGVALAACRHERVAAILTMLQNRLFDVGADLATPWEPPAADPVDAGRSRVRRIDPADATELERLIDEAWNPLPPMRNFILPGGTELAARLHLARAVCRRAERDCVTLGQHVEGIHGVVIFLNRLSDLLFALARLANHLENVTDVPWKK